MTTHCQICGREIRTVKGRDGHRYGAPYADLIAHHGYRRPHHQGWQTASCFGARYRPYEVACDALPPAIKRLTKYITEQEAALDNLMEAPPRGLHYERRDAYGSVRERPRSVLRPEGFTAESRDDCTAGSYANTFHNTRRGLERSIKAASADVVAMRKRLADWKAPNLEAAS